MREIAIRLGDGERNKVELGTNNLRLFVSVRGKDEISREREEVLESEGERLLESRESGG